MSYASVQDAKDQYGEDYVLTSVSRDDTPDLNAFAKALDEATSEIDSYIGGRYTVPLTNVPSVVKRRCVDMAIYIASADAGTYTDEKRKRYDDAIDWLTMVANGKAVLVFPVVEDGDGAVIDPGGTDEGDTDLPIVLAEPRLFTRCKMRGLL